MPTDAKRQAVAALVEVLRGSSAMAVADYRGLKVADMQNVRRSLRASGVQLHVAKNRLLKIAADEAGRPELKGMLEGPTALASTSGEEVALAKALQDAFRPYNRIVTIRGGLLGTRLIDAGSLDRMASLPSREVLLARLAGGMAAPLSGMAGVLSANLRNLVGVLNAVAEKKRLTAGGEAA
jgi:large subunit ribosomal protein L10